MSRTLRPLAAFAMLAVISVISAGCGSNTPAKSGTGSSGGTGTAAPAGNTGTTSTASSTGTASGSGSGAGSASSAREKAVKFAECMRENGYPDFPDPKASGEFPSFGISVTPAVWTNALRACKELQPPGSFSAHLTPKQLSEGLKFAQCIRAHGVKDFPDPVQGEPLVDTTKIPSANKPGGMTILNAAMYACRAFGPTGSR